MKKKPRKLTLVAILLGILALDTTGYILIENVNMTDALYMTVISITTVGYKEVFPLSPLGIQFTIFVIISGLGIFFYIARKVAEDTVEDSFRKILGRRKMRALSKMKDHIVVAGFGSLGEIVVRGLSEKKMPLVIIENSPERYARGEELAYSIIQADATCEDVLKDAGIQRARTFISLLSSDAENIFTVLTARELNPDIFIISRAIDIENETKLYKIGADRVISTNQLSSRRIINIVLKPNVVNLIDLVTQSEKLSLSLEEITIGDKSPLVGKSIRESGLRKNYNAIVVGLKRNEQMFFNPEADLEFQPGDLLVLIGQKDLLEKIS